LLLLLAPQAPAVAGRCGARHPQTCGVKKVNLEAGDRDVAPGFSPADSQQIPMPP
jgi:hypothetical protein